MMKENKSPFGAVLAGARESLGLTQLDLSTRCGLDQRTISTVETGRREPTLKTTLNYARALGLKVAELADSYERAVESEEVRQFEELAPGKQIEYLNRKRQELVWRREALERGLEQLEQLENLLAQKQSSITDEAK